MLPQTARKTADTQRSATTTPVADPHLTFQVEANAVYVWWGWIKYDSPVTADINIDFSAPTGSLGEWKAIGPGITRVVGATDATSPTLTSETPGNTGYMVRLETSDVATVRGYGGLGVGTEIGLDLKGTLRVAATGGTFSLDWCQRASDAGQTTLYTDSWITMIRIA
jgi:hypothetical protein